MMRRIAQPRALSALIAVACAGWLFLGSQPLAATFSSSPNDSPPPTVPSPIQSPLPTVPSPIETPSPEPTVETPLPPPPTATDAPTDTPPPTFTFTPSYTPSPSATPCPPAMCTPTPTSTASRTPTTTSTARPTGTRTPTRTRTPTPTAFFDGEPEIQFQVVVSPASAQTGDVVRVELIARNAGPVAAERPQYRLALWAVGNPVVVRPAAPRPVTHPSIAPGETDTVRYTFVATCPGTVTFWATITYQAYLGPGTAWSHGAGALLRVDAPDHTSSSCPASP